MGSIASAATELRVPALVAPPRHTALLTALFLALAAGGILFQKQASAEPGIVRHSGVARLYVSILAAEWGLLFFVWKGGLSRRGITLRQLIGGRWNGWRDLQRDALLAAGLWVLSGAIAALWDRLLGAGHATSIRPLLPQSSLEVFLWVLLSITAGICEEVVFRGYFLRQFAAMTRSRWAGLLLQAFLFGVSHGYQGVAACSKIAVYGLLFGSLALWRGSLRPGILAHAATDVLGGIFRI